MTKQPGDIDITVNHDDGLVTARESQAHGTGKLAFQRIPGYVLPKAPPGLFKEPAIIEVIGTLKKG